MSFLFWKKDKNEKVTEKEIKTNSAALFKLDEDSGEYVAEIAGINVTINSCTDDMVELPPKGDYLCFFQKKLRIWCQDVLL